MILLTLRPSGPAHAAPWGWRRARAPADVSSGGASTQIVSGAEAFYQLQDYLIAGAYVRTWKISSVPGGASIKESYTEPGISYHWDIGAGFRIGAQLGLSLYTLANADKVLSAFDQNKKIWTLTPVLSWAYPLGDYWSAGLEAEFRRVLDHGRSPAFMGGLVFLRLQKRS